MVINNKRKVDAASKVQSQNKENGLQEDSDGSDVKDAFKGFLRPQDVKLETKVHNKIIALATRSLSFYDTTLDEDTEILAADGQPGGNI